MTKKEMSLLLAMAFFISGFSLATGQKKSWDKEIFDQAQTAIYQKPWSDASKTLRKLTQDFPQSTSAGAPLYWQAYCLNKLSEEADEMKREIDMKKQAVETLNQLLAKFSFSSWQDDAKVLRIEIAEKLVKYGLPQFQKYIEGVIAGALAGAVSGVEGVKPGVEGGVGGRLEGLEMKEEDPELEMKLMALKALMSMEKEKDLPLLEKVARENPRARLRSRAVFIISQHDDPRVLPLLEEVALKDPDQKTRANAIFWLGRRGEEAASARIINRKLLKNA